MDRYAYSVREYGRPERRKPKRRAQSMSGMAMMQQLSDLYAPYVDSMDQMWQDMMAPWMEAMAAPSKKEYRRPHHHKKHDCDCGHCPDCTPDICYCTCCIGDADLVVYTRLGERRLVPIEIENSRRREREIRLELSNWSTRRGKPAEGIVAQLLPPTEFKLGPCEQHESLLVVNIGGTVQDSIAKIEKASEKRDDIPRLPDVEGCEILYADLRVEGCEIRPIRIALAILPRDCDPYEIECRCGCC